MSKKQIIKNIKKNSKNNVKHGEKDNFYKFVTSLTVILIILIVGYLVIGIFVTKEISFKKDNNVQEEETSDTVIDNTIITGGQIFNQKDNAYYVIVYDFDNKLTVLSTYVSNYSSKENSIPIYKVDSSKKLNSRYIVEENSNKSPTSYSDLRIISPTLIKIENSKVTLYVEGEEEIKSILKNN